MALDRGRGRAGGGLRRDRGRGRPRKSAGYSLKYSQRGRSALYRAKKSKGRRKRYRSHPMAGYGRQPNSGYKGGKVYRVVANRNKNATPRASAQRTGRTTTNSRYSAPKPAPKPKPKPKPPPPPPPPQKVRAAGYFDVLGYYKLEEDINYDKNSPVGEFDLEPNPVSDTPTDGEYGDYFDNQYPSDSLEIDIGLTETEFNNLWTWEEKYDVNGNVYVNGTADVQLAGDFSRIEIRIVEGP